MDEVALSAGPYALALRPKIGGAVSWFAWNGVDVFRRAPTDAGSVLDMGMFPLAPYANRIKHGRFSFDGRDVQLALNHGDHPHALHGHAWQRPWQVAEADAHRAVLSFAYRPGDWPWAYACEQRIELDETSALFTLTLRNASDTPMPASFGFHPYFPRRRHTRLTANIRGMWAIDETIMPTNPAPPILDLTQGAPLADAPFVDHCFTGWDHQATLRSEPAIITMTASGVFGFFHVYVPPEDDYFCAEPVSAMPDAVNRRGAEGNGLRILAPGEAISGWMRISVHS
jgi:aldose 1-epimerase